MKFSIALLVVAALVTQRVEAQNCDNVNNIDKFDCFPENAANPRDCEQRKCCWAASDIYGEDSDVSFPPLQTPSCYYPESYQGYAVTEVNATDQGNYHIYLKRQFPSNIDTDVDEVEVAIQFWNDNTMRIRITDLNKQRWEPPVPEISPKSKIAAKNFNISFDSATGNLKIARTTPVNRVLFSGSLNQLVFSERFMQFTNRLPSDVVFGLGERAGKLRASVNFTRITLFNEDRSPTKNARLYGTHPFYVNIEEDGNANGLFLLNSNAMDIILQPTPAVTYRPIGGIFDFFLFLGPTPAEVVAQYQDLVGRPAMPPYWGLGYHLCRWGYNSAARTKEIFDKNIAAGVPIEVQWNDIDYMERHNDFTVDPKNFADLPKLIDYIHQQGRHYVPILDPGVSGSEPAGSYPPYDNGLKYDLFVKNASGGIVYAKVWNDKSTVFPDFTHPNATVYWAEQFQGLYEKIKFDGAWIDMNEPSNMMNGHSDGCPSSNLENPPYTPGDEALNTRTLCMSDKHYIGDHYNVHSIYNYFEGKATYNALATIRNNKRPFIISRSTFSGSGHWVSHWTGDVSSSWEDLRDSITGVMQFSLFGIPLVGADICGFNGDTNEELCARWQALGAFYPFSRNHNTIGSRDQDPASMGEIVVAATVNTLRLRYILLPYLYTLFHSAHAQGDMVMRPLFVEFPTDKTVFDIDEQFLWGSGIMLAPALYKGQEYVNTYFPKAIWYSHMFEGYSLKSSGEWKELAAPIDRIGIFHRGGWIIPTQGYKDTVAKCRQENFMLTAYLDENSSAIGELYWDDGETIDTFENGQYKYISFIYTKNTLTIVPNKNKYEAKLPLRFVNIAGLSSAPSAVQLNGNATTSFKYEPFQQTVVISLDPAWDMASENLEVTLSF